MRITALILSAATTLFVRSSPPQCIDRLIAGESGARATVAAPNIAPERGVAGTRVTMRGTGFRPHLSLTIAAVFAENGCVIEGLGDQYLGSTRSDDRGAYSISFRWPARFDPVLGRNKIEPRALPNGRYYLFAMPCTARAACSFTAGTLPGGPFRLGPARASPAPMVAAATAVVLILGVLVARRRAR
jgi:hypothetical protein